MTSPHPRISARVSAIAESATLAVDTKAKALRAAGRPVIGFGAGEPDFPTPGYIVEAAQRACAEPRFHKYTPAAGLPELALANGIPVIEVNPERTPLSDGATATVRETAAGALPGLLQRLPSLLA